jgi:predicted phosphoribosyltransferase
MFSNRTDAGHRLANALAAYRKQHPLVLAIPRGAVPMGKVIADTLEGELDVVLVRKLTSPYSREYALGSVDESGWMFVADFASESGGTPGYMAQEKQRQMETLRTRRAQYTPFRQALDPKGRIAIVIDDGLATGSTMIAALHAVRAKQPAKLICAVPVAPPDTLKIIRPLCDEVVCLHAPINFLAVGQFYADFTQVSDEEVMDILRQTHAASNGIARQMPTA